MIKLFKEYISVIKESVQLAKENLEFQKQADIKHQSNWERDQLGRDEQNELFKEMTEISQAAVENNKIIKDIYGVLISTGILEESEGGGYHPSIKLTEFLKGDNRND